jgi:hypothetical protein
MPALKVSDAVAKADWVRERLSSFGSHIVSSVVPGGFEAYARVLHPAEEPGPGDRLVRWAEVAAWSGLPLRPDSQFHSIALPPHRPLGPAPWSSQGPAEGQMYLPDIDALAAVVCDWTETPANCWFCLWRGWGDLEYGTLSSQPVELPHRDYVLLTGPVDAAGETVRRYGHSAALWWPDDRSWCVATEIDLPWTYVGGTRDLIDAILTDKRIEALPASAEDSLTHVEDWVARWVDQAVVELLDRNETTISTSRGTVNAQFRQGELIITAIGDNGVTSEFREGFSRPENVDLEWRLTSSLIGLVGGL